MTRVVVDASCLGWPQSGIRRYVYEVVTRLAQDPRLEVVLVTNERRPVADVPGAVELPRRVKSGVLWRSTALVREARRLRADVLWCPWPMAPATSLGIPVVVTAHDLSPVLHAGTKPRVSTLSMALMGRRAVRRAVAVLCISGTTAEDVARHWGVPRARLQVVPLAVDPAFCPGDRQRARESVEARWGLAGPFLLAVGSIEPRKGYDLLPPLAQLLPELPVVLAGRPGPLSDALLPDLIRTCRVLGGVSDDELLELYRAAELLLTPSLYEGFGLTPMEALACGTPAVVAQGSGALEELLAGTMPVVVRDPQQWAEAVTQARAGRAGLVAAGLALARSRSWDDVARETAEVLLRAAAQ